MSRLTMIQVPRTGDGGQPGRLRSRRGTQGWIQAIRADEGDWSEDIRVSSTWVSGLVAPSVRWFTASVCQDKLGQGRAVYTGALLGCRGPSDWIEIVQQGPTAVFEEVSSDDAGRDGRQQHGWIGRQVRSHTERAGRAFWTISATLSGTSFGSSG